MAQAYQQTQQIDAPAQSQSAWRRGQLAEAMLERFSQPWLEFLENPVETGGREHFIRLGRLARAKRVRFGTVITFPI
ncbi:hypothetical protein [Thioalkalivibrio sp. ALJ1]|uniref:hypothetical protein n=1 Tax=Thioalkalivibrio sp. ALJ1 TaxID=1158144 RepID=UPI001FCAD14A|nr:hypothetical protein [Thioalkalivibrio sp. ALJ1]